MKRNILVHKQKNVGLNLICCDKNWAFKTQQSLFRTHTHMQLVENFFDLVHWLVLFSLLYEIVPISSIFH